MTKSFTSQTKYQYINIGDIKNELKRGEIYIHVLAMTTIFIQWMSLKWSWWYYLHGSVWNILHNGIFLRTRVTIPTPDTAFFIVFHVYKPVRPLYSSWREYVLKVLTLRTRITFEATDIACLYHCAPCTYNSLAIAQIQWSMCRVYPVLR